MARRDSIRLYERGEALKARCDELLRNAEMRIEKITLSADGKPKGVAPLDGDSRGPTPEDFCDKLWARTPLQAGVNRPLRKASPPF